MILIKEGILEKISNWTDDSVYILADFDRTITAANSESSWGVLSKSGLVTKEYEKERRELFEYYRPIEINEDMDYKIKNKLMIEWWNKHINLLVKYKLSEEIITKAANDNNVMSFRKGAKEFLENMRDRNIPVIIISAGIGNFVKQFLINNQCDFENIHIISNFIKFEKGIAVGIIGEVTHSLNKNEVYFSSEINKKLEKRSNIILFGDNIADVKMTKAEKRDETLKIGFLDAKVEENKKYYQKYYDIICINNTGYDELSSKVKILTSK